MKKRLPTLCLLLITALCLSGCLGPKPVVESYKSTPPAPGSNDPFTVDVLLANKGPGEGQAEVTVDLRDKQNNVVLASGAQALDLKANEETHVLFKLYLPPSAQNLDPQNIAVQVDAHYPIE